jgi:hypothetical protein
VLALVSPVGGSAFMAELFEVVADAVRRAGGSALTHEGALEDLTEIVDDVDEVVGVIVPHEYAAIYGVPPPALASRTIGFGVEHPGTATFETAARVTAALGASFEINATAVDEMRRRGHAAERFTLGYSPVWDHRVDGTARDVDYVHLGTADEARLRTLARIAPDLAGRRSEIVLAPHEPMLRGRSDVLLGADKWRLLARSRLLINLHREASTGFEWVRALEAICNGCVIATEPSTGLAPLVPGEHLLVARPERLGRVCAVALDDDAQLKHLAESALAASRSLDLLGSAEHLLAVAAALPSSARSRRRITRSRSLQHEAAPENEAAPEHDEPVLAEWVPTIVALGRGSSTERKDANAGDARPAEATTLLTRDPPPNADVDVICVNRCGDGPWYRTVHSLRSTDAAAIHLGLIGRTFDVEDAEVSQVTSVRSFSDTFSRGAARDVLWRAGAAPYVFVLDGGDELLDPGIVGALVATLSDDPHAGVVVPMAVLGSDLVVNALIPDVRRLERFAYLGRGFLVRRSVLESLGGFGDGDDSLTDHRFWCALAGSGTRSRLHRSIAVRLWSGHQT